MALGYRTLLSLQTDFTPDFHNKRAIRTVRGIMMSRATFDPIHLLYFVTTALGLIQVTQNLAPFLIPNVDIM